ncbi:MAG TPA: thiol reductant ABC exporter subunit CydD, partial [Chloroflexi bacterium]|nr:thiol reductant ABC exporter subunit CydD [Chloroflexota bacterium]
MDRNLLRQARIAWAALGLTVGLSGLGGLLAVLQAWFLSRIIEQVFLDGQALAGVTGDLTLLLGVIGLRAAAAMGSEVAAGSVAVRVKTDLRRVLFDHVLALGPTYTRGERSGELTATLVEGVEALDAYFSQYLPQLIVATLVPLTILVAVFPIDLLSALVLLLTAPLIPLFMILIGKAAEALTGRQYELLSRLSAHFLDILQGLTTLKLLGQSEVQVTMIGRISDQYRVATMRVLRVAFLSALVLELVATISTAIVAVEISLRLLSGRIGFQQALFVLILAPEFYLPLRMLGARFHAGAAGGSAARRIFEVLTTPLAAPQGGLARTLV